MFVESKTLALPKLSNTSRLTKSLLTLCRYFQIGRDTPNPHWPLGHIGLAYDINSCIFYSYSFYTHVFIKPHDDGAN